MTSMDPSTPGRPDRQNRAEEPSAASTPGDAATGRTPRASVLVRITGRVQGVGYRYWTMTRAERLRLQGYVRNLTDGSVEALFVGDAVDVARMLVLCEEGPADAVVERVETRAPPPDLAPGFQRFRRLATRNPGESI